MESPSLSSIRQPDSSGRIVIGKEYTGKLFLVAEQPNGDILLSPVVIRHEREAWLYENPTAMQTVQEGLRQAANGEVVDGGDFTQFLEEE